MERLHVRWPAALGVVFVISTATAQAQTTAAAQAATQPKIDGPTVYDPVAPRVFTGDLRRVAKTSIWREGDPVREVQDLKQTGGGTGCGARPDGNSIVAPPAGAPLPPSGSPLAFDGIPATGWTPPDTVGDIGPKHYVQMVNISFAIYDRAGTLLAGPFRTAAELRELLPSARMLPGRATYYVRLWTPLAKVVQRLRGNHRITPDAMAGQGTP